LYGRGEPADAVTVASELVRTGDIGRVGGHPYLHTLLSSVPTATNAGYYAEIVAEKATLRRLVQAGDRISQMGYGANEGAAGFAGAVDEVVDRAQAELYAVGETRDRDDLTGVAELLEPAMDQVERVAADGGVVPGAVPTGLSELDEMLHGFQPGQMVIVAGRPGSGKTSLATGAAAHAAIRQHLPTAVFSLEMSKMELMMRLLAAEACIPLNNLRSGRMSDRDWSKLAGRSGEISEAPLYIDDSPNLTVTEIRAKARRMKQRHGLALVVVDYLQLMTAGRRVESRQQEVSEFSRALKLLAKELEVPVVALSQLNRGPEQRVDKKPMLSDLRESGSLEQDSDVVLLVHREDLYNPETPRAGEADLIVAKHRNGPTGTVSVIWQASMSKFVDPAR
jgi:replicative DNA helicase